MFPVLSLVKISAKIYWADQHLDFPPLMNVCLKWEAKIVKHFIPKVENHYVREDVLEVNSACNAAVLSFSFRSCIAEHLRGVFSIM